MSQDSMCVCGRECVWQRVCNRLLRALISDVPLEHVAQLTVFTGPIKNGYGKLRTLQHRSVKTRRVKFQTLSVVSLLSCVCVSMWTYFSVGIKPL